MLTPEIKVGTSLEVLAPYLPYGIEVETIDRPRDQRRGIMKGLVVRHSDEYDYDDVKLQLKEPYTHHAWYATNALLPVLRPFSILCEPLQCGAIPAERVLDILEIPIRKGERLHINDSTLWVSTLGLVKGVWTLGRFMAPEIPMDVARYLQSAHFAVGLEAHQYIAKESAAPAPFLGTEKPGR